MAVDKKGDLSWIARLKPTDLNEFVSQVNALERDDASHVGLKWQAGPGTGALRAIARAPVYHHETVRALLRLREHVEERGGSLILQRAPIETKRELDAWGDVGSAAELMQQVKRQLDPESVLSPGRFF
jgi:FAD/FMN-containing dehydrogenase